MEDTHLIHISDLFGQPRVFQKGRPLDERATLIKFFVDELARPPKFLGVRLGHFQLDQLYALQSSFKDRLRRPCGICLKAGMTGPCAHSIDTAHKYFWWATRTARHDAVL